MADRPPLLYESDFRHLFIACDSGNVETVKSLLEKYYNSDTVSLFINQWDERTDETPLFRAAMRGHHEIVLTLLQYQANPDLVNQNKVGIIYHRKGKFRYWSALMIASSNDDTEMAKILLDHGADIKLRERNEDRGTSALIIAVQRGHHETVKLLLERGADANEGLRTFDSYQHKILKYEYIIATVSVLMFACEEGYARIARILLEFGANVNFSNEIGLTALIIVCSRGDIEIFRLLLDFGAEINVRCTETPEILLEYDVDVNDYDTSALLAAVRGGHTEIAKLLLERGADVNMLDNSGTSALLIAVRNGHAKTAKLLLEHGADVDVLHTISDSVFLDIIEYGHTGAETARLLLELGADMNMLGKSAFFYVVRGGHTESAKLLLELGVDVDLVDNYGRSALLIAIKRRNTKTAKLLLEHGADVNMVEKYDRQSGLIIACQEGCIDVVELLLEFGANIDIQDGTGWTALMYASKKGYTKIVEILLNHQPNLNLQASDGSSALYLAIISQHIEICKLLLKNGASLKLKYSDYRSVLIPAGVFTIFTEYSKGRSALMVACAMKGTLTDEIVKLLLNYKNDVNMLDASGWSALAIVSHRGNSERTKLLLEHGAYVNLQHTELKGRSALQIASEGCHTSTTEILLEYGADVNIKDNDGWTALMLTSQDGFTETAKVLLEHQANVNQQKNDGWSALMIASYNGQTEMIELLVKYDAAINLLEDEGWSALMIACKMSRVEAVKLLLSYEADVNILNNSGWSALMITSYVGCREICELLLKFGANISIEDEHGWSALRAASYERRYVISELLKESGARSGHKRVASCRTVSVGSENLSAEIIQTVLMTQSEQHISWDQFGIKVYAPQDSKPEEIQQCIVHVEVNTMGNHQLPQNTYLVSPVYSIKCIPKCQFTKSLILEIQHCAKQDNVHKLCFISSTGANRRFDIIDSGDDTADHVYYSFFPRHCSYGYIELDRFCQFAVAQTQTERGLCKRIYRANIFYEKENARRYKVHFVILWDTNAHNKIICEHYEKRNASLEIDQAVEFIEEQIDLDVPFPCSTGVTSQNKAWRILSLNPPVINKIDVDNFLSGEDERRIPSCQLLIKCDEGEPTDLDHVVKLNGAKKPHEAFMISISANRTRAVRQPESVQPGIDTEMSYTTLLRELSETVSADWEDIGLILKLAPGSLDIIKINYPSHAKKCFREMIKLWFKQVDPLPSWTTIIDAIDILGHKPLAENLSKKFL